MSVATEKLLKKISYIEADIQIQKQILYSIPSKDTAEIEKTLQIIAGHKASIHDLRDQIQETDPDEFNRIIKFESASEQFRRLATEKKFKQIIAFGQQAECNITLNTGERVECLIKAEDEAGNWTILSFDGDIRHYTKGELDV